MGRRAARSRAPLPLDVPTGTVLLLLAGEWIPEPGRPARRDALVSIVAVGVADAGTVLAPGHACNPHSPDCGRHHCWEAQVVVAAIKENLAGAR